YQPRRRSQPRLACFSSLGRCSVGALLARGVPVFSSPLGDHMDRNQEDLQALAEGAAYTLHNELTRALHADPRRIVWTPRFHNTRMSAADVVLDHFAGQAGEYDAVELLSIVA